MEDTYTLSFEQFNQSDLQEVTEHVARNFSENNPLFKQMGFTYSDYFRRCRPWVQKAATQEQNLSIVVKDSKTNKIIGLSITLDCKEYIEVFTREEEEVEVD